MNVWTFALAVFPSLPKQFATVYIGVIIEGVGQRALWPSFGTYQAHYPTDETTPQRIASYSLIAATTVVTVLAAWYIYRKLNRIRPAVIYDRRKAWCVHSTVVRHPSWNLTSCTI
jgi:hypothetical protein